MGRPSPVVTEEVGTDEFLKTNFSVGFLNLLKKNHPRAVIGP